jgi:hypothetical protein
MTVAEIAVPSICICIAFYAGYQWGRIEGWLEGWGEGWFDCKKQAGDGE